ncbi:3-hydroxyacyl-CoA dehydrogenase family protein [Variovorax sp.]|uniref:3-hydroxyacyl-CoA dehydrogenase family protein n=1 Tax=Variovorax sp. TaxID=1871043 RepID=UPI003BAB23F8
MHGKNRRVAVVGAGLMGVGIATCLALAGEDVDVFDLSDARRGELPALAEKIFEELIAAGRIEEAGRDAALARIRVVATLAAMADATLVFEAVVERLEVKHALYAELEALLPSYALIASNTSGFMPDVLCERMQHPERFLVAHFWNPPHVIPFVELVPATATAPDASAAVRERLEHAGFEAVLLSRAAPGFIGNRIQFAVLREALHLVQSGVADAATVDTVVRSCIGRRYASFGPFETADLGGLCTFLDIAGHLMPELESDASGLQLLKAMVATGHWGAAVGQGFYEWTDAHWQSVRERRLRMLTDMRSPH